jgi:hypothetical protein
MLSKRSLPANLIFAWIHRKISWKLVHVIGGYNLENPREKTGLKYTFPSLGTYEGNGRVLKFRTIWNDNSQCYNV